MFHPVGSQPPAVYWRRRLFLIGSVVLVVVLLVLTFNAIRSDGNGQASAGSPTTSTRSSTPAPSTSASRSTPRRSSSTAKSSSSTASTPQSASTPAAPDCEAADLRLRSVTGQSTYKVGDSPLLQLQVTNIGPQPCVQNLADKEVELRVYNGESRIWGSHDCKVEPGTLDRTLTPDRAILVSIKWSGLTSAAGCKATRQRVGAGTYTLFASLAGKAAPASQFTIG